MTNIDTKSISVEFNKKQYLALIRAVYLGNWLANAIHTDLPDDKRLEEFDEIEDYVLAHASEIGLDNLVERESGDKRWFPTRELDESLESIIEEYDDEAFWDGLFHNLSDRDFSRAYSEREILEMPLLERFEKEEPFRNKWDDELGKHGIERLDVIEKKTKK